VSDHEGDIHPRNKQDVGSRATLAALQEVYGLGVEGSPASCPTVSRASGVQGADLVVSIKVRRPLSLQKNE
jgi:hypothetical protein